MDSENKQAELDAQDRPIEAPTAEAETAADETTQPNESAATEEAVAEEAVAEEAVAEEAVAEEAVAEEAVAEEAVAEEAVAEEAVAEEAAVAEPVATAEKAESPDGDKPNEIDDLKPGMRLQGRVRNVVEFGAFIDVGVGRDGLAHVSTLKRAGIDKTIKEGDVLDVQIRRIDADRNRISLTIPGAGKGAKKSLKELQVNTVVPGRVVRLVDFGAFIDVGAQTDGLLHISEITDGYVSHPSQALNVGDELEVRILEVDVERRRISLSTKGMEVEVEGQPQPQSQAQSQRQAQRQPVAAPANESDAEDNEFPTAFQVAWESALRERSKKARRR
jgi:small subunit ribosomal protein S1